MPAPETKTPADRVRERMERWMTLTGLSQREFAADLDKTQVWLQKVLAGENDVRLRNLDEIARAMRTTAAELVRDDEVRYQLELTPTEVRLIEQLRRRPDAFRALTMLLDIPYEPIQQDAQTGTQPRKKPGKGT